MKEKFNLEDIFMPVGFPKYTFVERESLKISITSAKMNKNKHINIFGSSKSGKSNLWRRYFSQENFIKIGINKNTTIDDVYSEILSELEVYYTSEKSNGKEVSSGLVAEIKAKIALICESKIKADLKDTRSEKEKLVRITKPIISANTVIRFLKLSHKIVVIEDFHYANSELISQMAEDLKNFSDETCKFILVSVQHMTPELYKSNRRELQGRITDIPVGLFDNPQLLEIINKGCDKLNIEFSHDIKQKIISEVKNSAALTQDICQKICILSSVLETTDRKVVISDVAVFDRACKFIAEEQRNIYEKITNAVKSHSHGNNKTEIYKWLLLFIQKTDIPDIGIGHNEVFRKIKELGHQTILMPSVTNGLKYLPKIMEKNDLDIYFEFNKNNMFILHDRYLQFVFRWLPDLIESLFNE